MGLKGIFGFAGVAILMSSRTTVYCVGPPVDSAYILAVAVIAYLMITQRWALLAVLGPLLVVFKEPVLAWLLLPLLVKPRRWYSFDPSPPASGFFL